MDVTVVVLPMPVLWGLQTAVGKKLVLSGMFGLGIMYVHFSLRLLCAILNISDVSS